MERKGSLSKLKDQNTIWDIAIIGGGATGLGVALDAVSRGYKVILLEQSDFAKGTSSRSTKLVHGGVRYLAQGNIMLVLEALKERGLLLKNAPHLVKNQTFVIPIYYWWDGLKYTLAMKLYNLLAGKLSFGKSAFINKKKTIDLLPNLNTKGLKGGVVYHDGQFDDARLAIDLAQTCAEKDACLLNYMKVIKLNKDEKNRVTGLTVQDAETQKEYQLGARVVINATGVFVDNILKMDDPKATNMIRASQGVHIVLERSFLNGDSAIMIPKTTDGRVLFAVPWHDKVIVGTTDTLRESADLEPVALDSEISFILNTTGKYLVKAPTKEDVRAVYAGLRPLAVPQGNTMKTKEISRSHKVQVSKSGLITISGGKWTTFRKMGEEVVDKAIKISGLPFRDSTSGNLKINGYLPNLESNHHLSVYGLSHKEIEKLIEKDHSLAYPLHPNYPYTRAEVIWAARHEMARTVEDVLARRIRILFLDARASVEMAPEVADLLAHELDKDTHWVEQQIKDFNRTASNYFINSIISETV